MTGLRIESDLMEVMRRIKDEEGIPVTVQIEFAVREWLERRGAIPRRKKAK